ncbi:MAG TPA: DMT family protein [Cytophagaceae bacterium]|jgi:hypothetical protein
MKGFTAIVLLLISNAFMTLAWYGHLYLKNTSLKMPNSLVFIIFLSWGIALFEYIFQVPANRIGFSENGGPFNLFQLKVIQEVISLTVFCIFTLVVFKSEKLQWNYIAAFVCIVLAVFFIFKKWD